MSSNFVFQLVAIAKPLSEDQPLVNICYTFNSLIMGVLLYFYYKYDNEEALRVCSILNIARQAIRIWDFEDTRSNISQTQWINIMFLQQTSVMIFMLTMVIAYADCRGTFLIS